jgi:hypothetical protein
MVTSPCSIPEFSYLEAINIDTMTVDHVYSLEVLTCIGLILPFQPSATTSKGYRTYVFHPEKCS